MSPLAASARRKRLKKGTRHVAAALSRAVITAADQY